ncbi:MAG TPA: DUF4398 domain-containing protein [Gemmatimonadaceae bacterium]|nr:DUF4398 domain-containing protein [Gemmatimonadaceae bacterium]
MRSVSVLAAIALLSGCATAGVPFPPSGNAGAALTEAEEAIQQARHAGADSLAPAPFLAARAYLSEAERQARENDPNRAAVRARQATAEARYARALVALTLAQRDRAAALAALDAIASRAPSDSTRAP